MNEMTQGQRQRAKSREPCSRKMHIGGRQRGARGENRKKPEKQENQKNETSRSPGEKVLEEGLSTGVNPAERSDALGAEVCPLEGAVWQFGREHVQGSGPGAAQIRKNGEGGGEEGEVASDFFSRNFVGNRFDGASFPSGGKI